ncbi:hypothetical protein V8G54_018080 [Vigna mungo]|uniref:Uncharacterized protein n=1 Tax=Vigna mungo TaxID=3915 RepID=A0AAQ3RR49_VIGMU
MNPHCKILLMDPPLNPSKNREKMVETMFEKYNFNRVLCKFKFVPPLFKLHCSFSLILIEPVWVGYLSKIPRHSNNAYPQPDQPDKILPATRRARPKCSIGADDLVGRPRTTWMDVLGGRPERAAWEDDLTGRPWRMVWEDDLRGRPGPYGTHGVADHTIHISVVNRIVNKPLKPEHDLILRRGSVHAIPDKDGFSGWLLSL